MSARPATPYRWGEPGSRVRWSRPDDKTREARCGEFVLVVCDHGDPGFSLGEPWSWRVERDGETITRGGGWGEDLVIEDGLRALATAVA